MHDSRKSTMTGRIPSPQEFRAAATGIGQTLEASERTGAIRAQRVANSCDPQCAKMLPNSYPSPYRVAEPGEEAKPAKPAPVATTHSKPEPNEPVEYMGMVGLR